VNQTRESRAGEGNRPAHHEASRTIDTARVTDAVEIPEYLSDAWWALPVDDWRRLAAVTIAANRWHAIAESAYGWDLLAEATDWHGRRTFSDWSSAVAEAVKGRRLGPTHVELERRRAVVGDAPRKSGQPAVHASFVERHGGEFGGGAVDWHTGRPVVGQTPTVAKGAA
jgi:hypothetical protein